MLLQEFLRNEPDALKKLQEAPYFIKVKRHTEYPELFLLKYDQIESDFSNPLVCQARGIIFNEQDNYRIISYSYDKFFNAGDPKAAVLDWDSVQVCEKADGSLCTLYFYKDQWHVATSGTPDASGEVNNWGITFKDLFWRTWNELGYSLPDRDRLDDLLCYSFELCTKENRVIVQHKKPKILLHGVRVLNEKFGFTELPYYRNRIHGTNTYYYPGNWLQVKSYPLQTIEEIIESTKLLNPIENEGYVLVDGNFNRIKVKSPQYLALSHIRDGWGPKRIIEILRSYEGDEFISLFPEFKEEYYKFKTQWDSLVQELEELYLKTKDIENQKEFALAIKHHDMASALFSFRRGITPSIKHYLSEVNINTLLRYFNIK